MSFVSPIFRIESRLKQAFMFKALNKEEIDIVIGAMAEISFKSGSVIIKQGEAGAVLYVVEEGQLTCHKLFDGDSELKFLKMF
jgi:cAMP-dependent protein kinase regulator